MKIAYIRVSSSDQNLDRQKEALHQISPPPEKTFEEYTSGKNINDREVFMSCMDFCREGDHLVMTSIDRCARSLLDLMNIIETLDKKGVKVEFLKERLVFTPQGNGNGADPMSKLLLQIMGSFAEFERALINERQAAGIKSALLRGVAFGRRHKFTLEECQNIFQRVADGESSISVARDLGVTRQTIYKSVRRGGTV